MKDQSGYSDQVVRPGAFLEFYKEKITMPLGVACQVAP